MKLLEGQLWKKGDVYYRILHRENLGVIYKEMKDPLTKEGTEHQALKKEFCKLIKGAVLMTPMTIKGE
jgi:hypothetical protein